MPSVEEVFSKNWRRRLGPGDKEPTQTNAFAHLTLVNRHALWVLKTSCSADIAEMNRLTMTSILSIERGTYVDFSGADSMRLHRMAQGEFQSCIDEALSLRNE